MKQRVDIKTTSIHYFQVSVSIQQSSVKHTTQLIPWLKTFPQFYIPYSSGATKSLPGTLPPVHYGVVNTTVLKSRLRHGKQETTSSKRRCPVCLPKGCACASILSLASNKTCKVELKTLLLLPELLLTIWEIHYT